MTIVEQNLYTACVTPFNGSGSDIDYVSLERLLRSQENNRNGIMLLGSTGESLSLSLEERKAIVRFVCSLNLTTQLIIGVPSYNLQVALEWIEFCNDLPISGYMMTTPIYTKPGIQGQIKWFETLINHANYPVMLYNIPSRTGIQLYPQVVTQLANNPKCVAIKDSSGLIESVVNYKLATDKVAIYCGDDYLMPAMASEGAKGLVSVASNAWPRDMRKYVSDSLQGLRIKDINYWQGLRSLFVASNPVPIKFVLQYLGILQYSTVRLPLNKDDLIDKTTLIHYAKYFN